ncbi:MAG: lysostaphin resistance A-like protein [Candidatus Paceibacterota bacterium]
MAIKKIILGYSFLFLLSFFCFRVFLYLITESTLFYNQISAYFIGAFPLMLFIFLAFKNNPFLLKEEFKDNFFWAIISGVFLGVVFPLFFKSFYSDVYGFFENNFIFGLFYWLFIAFSQEVYFRGFLLKEFYKRYPLLSSLIINSFLFAFWHLTVPFSPLWLTFSGLFRVFITSFFWGLIYLKTGNLLSPFIAHFLTGLLLSKF